MSQMLEVRRQWPALLAAVAMCFALGGPAWAEDAAPSETPTAGADEAKPDTGGDAAEDDAVTIDQVAYAVDNITLFLCAVLVLFMQAGFAMLEAGFNEAKNVVNILSKNLLDLAVGALLFFAVGFAIMYPGNYDTYSGGWNGYFAFGGFGIYSSEPEVAAGNLSPQCDWFFQAVFAATAATIVSGAVAGRMKFPAYLIYSGVITGLVYPVSGAWKWGGGWLDAMGFHDFAGSVVVHAVGGFAGLAGALALGPRIGRFGVEGKSQPILGHNMAYATLGVMILWVGWYGFNPGSQLAFVGAANTNATMLIAVNTTLAPAAGAVVSLAIAWILFGKPDLSMAINGALAGLVGITANCDCVTNNSAVAIGAIAGVIVVLAIILLDKLKIDDPVGAFPVHGACGLWGCIAAGIFGGKDLGVQVFGSVVIAAWSFVTMLVLFFLLRAIGILRVSAEDEQSGLDISEHGMHAYGKPST